MHHIVKLHIKFSDKFDIDLCATFLNFQLNSLSDCLVNAITPEKLQAPCLNFTGMFAIVKSPVASKLTLSDLFQLSS